MTILQRHLKDWKTDDFFFFYSAIKTVFRMKTELLYISNAITLLPPDLFTFNRRKNNDDVGHGILKE